ncbi:hypothetical protein PY365_26245 [Roseiarcaceae bacterium H3SJ34-1]|uniref:hypothetical protein n=1 Tax=Terripilifer ovatus TaxID=3032367 RepID=UPI003AB951D8|nr:hypothetical protein [Roseiarcaceae bacterium H3SJ34-1]
MPRKLSLTTDYLVKFCFAGIAVCALVAIVVAGQAIFSTGPAVKETTAKEAAAIPATTTPAANAAAAVTPAASFVRPAGSQPANVEAKDDAPTLSPPLDIFGSVPRKVTTVRVGADGKLATNP